MFWSIFNPTVLGEFISVAVFLLGAMVFFAWIAVTLFINADTLVYEEGEEKVFANKGMEDFPTALYTMFVAGASGEFIDCFLPSYTMFRASGILWMIYLMLTQVLLKNLVMDTLVTAFVRGDEQDIKDATTVLAEGVLKAFNKLSNGTGEVQEDDFREFVKELQKSPLSEKVDDRVVAAICRHKSYEKMTKDNFCDICEVLSNKYQITKFDSSCPTPQWLKRLVMNSAELKAASALKSSAQAETEESPTFDEPPAFDQFMNKVLLINLALVLMESYYNLCDDVDEPAWMDYLDLIFSFVYVGEVAVKLSVKSFKEYWLDSANQFDFWTTWLLLFTSLLPYLSKYEGLDLSRYANILRLLRLVRILKQLKSYESVQLMMKVVARSIETASEILSLMGVSFFFFAALSVNLFGGLIYEGNPKLEETEYAEKQWYVLNFNDMFMALNTWFMQILLEYVPLYADAISKVSDYGSIAWVIVLLFFITTAAIMYELLQAFTLTVFIAVKEEGDDEVSDDESDSGREESQSPGHHVDPSDPGGSGPCGHVSPHRGHEHPEAHDVDDLMDGDKVLEELGKDFEKQKQSLHWDIRLEPSEVREVAEAYEKYVHHDKDRGAEVSLSLAAWEFENTLQTARDGLPWSEFRCPSSNIEQAREKHFKVQRATMWYNRAIVGLVCLTILEVPPWCHEAHMGDKPNPWEWRPGHEWCPAPNGTKWNMNLSGIWYLPPGYALVVEVIIELMVLRKFYMELNHNRDYFEGKGLHSRRNIFFGVFFAIGSIVDTAIFAVYRGPIRGVFFFRTGLLCLLPGVQRLWDRIANGKMLEEFTSVAVFFVGAVVFFAWIAVTIFKDSKDVAFEREGEGVMVNAGLDTLRHSIYTMFLAGMTEGFVDILLPTYTKYRSSILLWIVFLLVTQVLLLNLVIDAFSAAYLKGSEKLAEGSAKTTAKGFLRVFHLIGRGDEVTREDFRNFVEELGKSPSMNAIPLEVADAIHDKMAEPNTATLHKHKFCHACSLLQNKIWVTSRDSFITKGWLHDKVTSSSFDPPKESDFDFFMSWVLLANLVVVVAQSYFNLSSIEVPPFLELASDFFTFCYVGEVALKLSVRSFAHYWSSGANRFDFFTTWLLFGTGVLKYLPFSSVKGELAHYANIMRLLRLVRVVKQMRDLKGVQFMILTVTKMIRASGDILSTLGVVLFFFSTFSVNFFGGVLAEGDHRLKETEYEKKHWFIFNFNDHVMAFATWFTQLLGEYEPEWAEALSRCSSMGDYAWWIFPAFYLIGVAMLFEILKAFTIELYLTLKIEEDRKESAEDEDEEAAKEAKKAERDEDKEEEKFQEEITRDLWAAGYSLHVIHKDSKTFKRKLKEVYTKLSSEPDKEARGGGRH
jgi:two pore calcium channel protein